LVVTEKNTNKIVVYHLTEGVAGKPEAHTSHGMTPFGFAFDRRDDLLVSEAFGGQANASALSSYDFDDGTLSLASGSIPSEQSAACWTVTARHGRFAYVTNTGSGTVTGYKVARDGELTRLTANGITGVTGGGPTDAATDSDSDTLYVLSPSIGQIVTFHVHPNGSLRQLGAASGVAASAAGLVAR
jgi:6-phosphogluconolactonase